MKEVKWLYKGKTRLYECSDNHIVYYLPDTYCVFCKHCTDYIYDDTNGPYCCLCELGLVQEETEYEFKCDTFEDSGYVFDQEDYNKRIQAIMNERKRFIELLRTNPDAKKAYDNMVEELFNKILYGDTKK